MNFDECFPDKKINAAEKYLRKLWNGEEHIAFSAYPSEPAYRQIEDHNEMVKIAARNIMEGAYVPGQNIPRLIADFGTVSTAAYWGGERYKPIGGCIGIKPILFKADEANTVKPEAADGGDAQRAYKLWKDVSTQLNTSRLPCTAIDIQGPLNTAALLWQQEEFMIAMYNEPAQVHKLLDQVTEHIIQIIKAMKKSIGYISGPMWPYIWLPTDIGVGITEDYMPLLSPKLYKEFGIPYVEKISREFGGVFIHCCGEYAHQIENLRNSNINILGLEFHYPYTHPLQLFNAFGSSVVFVPFLDTHGKNQFAETADYFGYIKSIRPKDTRIWFILSPEDQGFLKQIDIVESMK